MQGRRFSDDLTADGRVSTQARSRASRLGISWFRYNNRLPEPSDHGGFRQTSGASTSNIEGTAAARASLLDIPDTAMAGMRAGSQRQVWPGGSPPMPSTRIG